METGLPAVSIMKYDCFVNLLFTSCKLTLSIHYNAGHTYTMQELVKEVTLIKHSINGFAILHGNKLVNYNFLINPFSSDMHISPTIHYNAGHSNTGADE